MTNEPTNLNPISCDLSDLQLSPGANMLLTVDLTPNL